MTIETPTANVVIPKAQADALESARARLATIENSIAIANNDLVILKRDSLRVTKDLEYQDGLLKQRIEENEQVSEKLSIVKKAVQEGIDGIAVKNKELDERMEQVKNDEAACAVRLAAVDKIEKDVSAEKQDLHNKLIEQQNEKEEIVKIKGEILAVINSVPWK